jgi:hypothetical protein
MHNNKHSAERAADCSTALSLSVYRMLLPVLPVLINYPKIEHKNRGNLSEMTNFVAI